MDDDLARLTPRLGPGERLLWSGRPDPGKHLGPPDVFLVPFSLLWCGFAVFWLTGVIGEGAPVFFVVFGAAFVLLGLYFVAGRFIVKAARKRRTVYGLTDRRVLVDVLGSSLAQTPVGQVSVEQRRSRDGRHVSVTFGDSPRGFGAMSYGNTGVELFGRGGNQVAFHDVADVAGLENALRAVGR